MFKVKLRKTDNLFSRYIRGRANWKCEHPSCGKDYRNNPQGLHCSHYWSRSRESTRFDEENAIALCFYHHQNWGHGEGRDEYKAFMIQRLGQEGFDRLMLRAHLYCKRDDKAVEIILKHQLE